MAAETVDGRAAERADDFGRLTPRGIEKFREKVGLDWAYTRWTTWNEEATRDGIRHYAFGFGDDNPLWVDPAHAASSRWGGIISPPGFLEGAGLTPRVPRRREDAGRGKGALSGVHLFWAGDHIRYFNPVREGDRLWVRRFYVDIKEKESRSAGRSAVSVRRRVYWNDRGELDERTASGSLRVRLPSRERGLPEFPEPPSDHGLLPGMAEPEEGPWVR